MRACDKSTKAEVKAVLDFLSAIPPWQQRKAMVQGEVEEGVQGRGRDQEHVDGEKGKEGEGEEERRRRRKEGEVGEGELCDLNA